MSVVPFKPPAPPDEEILVWVCLCGCQTFRLQSDGMTECARCKTVSGPADDDRWFRNLPTPPEPDAETETIPDTAMSVTSLHSSSAALRHTLEEADADKTAVLVIIQEDGGLSVWHHELDSPASVEWLDGRMAAARAMILPLERKSK